MVSLSIMLHGLSKPYANFTEQIVHILNPLPENGTFFLAFQKFKCYTIILVNDTQSFKRFSKPCSLILTMFWSFLTFISNNNKINVLIGWQGQILQRKPDGKIRLWQFDPKQGSWIYSNQNSMWSFYIYITHCWTQSEKWKKGHLNQWHFYTQFLLQNPQTYDPVH